MARVEMTDNELLAFFYIIVAGVLMGAFQQRALEDGRRFHPAIVFALGVLWPVLLLIASFLHIKNSLTTGRYY